MNKLYELNQEDQILTVTEPATYFALYSQIQDFHYENLDQETIMVAGWNFRESLIEYKMQNGWRIKNPELLSPREITECLKNG